MLISILIISLIYLSIYLSFSYLSIYLSIFFVFIYLSQSDDTYFILMISTFVNMLISNNQFIIYQSICLSEDTYFSLIISISYWHVCKHLSKLSIYVTMFILPSRLKLQNTPTVSLQRGKTHPTNVLDMTLYNLMVRFQ